MSDPSSANPTRRFTGLADIYAKHRPEYPSAALDFVLDRCGLGAGSLLADVGSGTGISARQFALRGLRVIGIEPNVDMRAQAEQPSLPPGVTPPVYRTGRAEATGLPPDSADAVLAAQAFHWFANALALAEFRRILKPGGRVILMTNERDETDPFTLAFGDVVRTAPDAVELESMSASAGDFLAASPLFVDGQRADFANQQLLDEKGLVGRAFSMSYAPREPAQAEAFAARLREVFGLFQQDGKVVVQYRTSVLVARKNAKHKRRS